MASRIFLLLLVTFTFATAWSLDRPPELATNDDSLVPRKPSTEEAPPELPTGRPTHSPLMSWSLPTLTVLGEAVPRPKGISPGAYCVVRNDGRTDRIQVSSAADHRSIEAEADSFRVELGDRCWHFIRVKSPTAKAEVLQGF